MASTIASGSVMNMRELELRFVIKFLTKEGKNQKKIHERMNALYCDVSPSYYQVKVWSKEFKWGRESIEEDSLSVGQWKHLQRKRAKTWRT